MNRLIRCGALCAAVTLALAGCVGARPDPYAIEPHEGLVEYQQTRLGEYLARSTGTLYTGFSGLTDFEAVGYAHIRASTGTQRDVIVTVQYAERSFLAKEASNRPETTIDEVHIAGSDETWVLLGFAYVDKLDATPWVVHPEADVDLAADPMNVCAIPAAWFVCAIADASLATASGGEGAQSVPMPRFTDDTSGVHIESAVSARALLDAGMFTFTEELQQHVTEEMLEQLLPVNYWFTPDGVLSHAEVNGTVRGGDFSLEMQFGLELTGGANPDDIRQARPRDVGRKFVTRMDAKQWEEFSGRLGEVRTGDRK